MVTNTLSMCGEVVNTAKPKAVLNAVKGNQINAVKASACWGNPQQDLEEKGVIDNGCSRHMTRNMSYLTDFEEIDGGYVSFGGNPKGGKITGRGTIKTGNLDFENVKQLLGSALGFMTPFGCPVTILNTIDHLGKFDGKADEGFIVGYSVNSKAFKVFSSRTRIVEENLHVQFSENTPNIAGSGPNWLFDIDALTNSMNYKPVAAGNQSNGNACTKACDDAGKARIETVPGKDYILLPLWTADPPFSQSSKISPDVGFKPSGDDENPRKDSEGNNQEKEDNDNSTNNVNAASSNEVNVVGAKTSIDLPDDPNMPELEDIVYSDDDEDVGVEADINNLDAFMPVSPIPTTRIHKDHPLEQIIGDLNSAPQTRRMTKKIWKNMACLVLFSKEQTIKTFKIACLHAFYHKKNPKR
ncbi:ribonuclease H-like domain-containing protein [Tanacetum coccineum]